ncbi:hypothetical protein EJB05_25961 [Eragrostis curvula]|uniref:Uncharacterized protein n=1 Tax=Eragrostis curvula TaxID=38414 RepID=A0A5J9UK00_9POAL|nr:hypothetical protein EJB05_25961 [Eragrostis curvula]
MSTNSPSYSPADLEKGTAASKEVDKEEELSIVDPQKAKLCSRLMDSPLQYIQLRCSPRFFVLLFAGFAAYVFKHSSNWRDMSLGLLVLVPVMAWNFWLIPKLKRLVIKAHATKQSQGSDNDLSAKTTGSREINQ